jgi:thiol-disulfide isomerase/thioredoxin
LLLAFWFPNCQTCRTELPQLEKYYRNNHTGEFEIVAIDVYADRQGGITFIREQELSFVFLSGSLDIAEAYGVYSTPTLVLLDSDGKIAASSHRFDDSIRNGLIKLLEE